MIGLLILGVLLALAGASILIWPSAFSKLNDEMWPEGIRNFAVVRRRPARKGRTSRTEARIVGGMVFAGGLFLAIALAVHG